MIPGWRGVELPNMERFPSDFGVVRLQLATQMCSGFRTFHKIEHDGTQGP